MKCGKQLKKEEKEYCGDCTQKEHFYQQGTALYDYGSMADSIFRFKYGGRMEYALFYGKELYERKGSWLHAIRPDALVPVPIHPARKRKRGYNQAELLAEELGRILKLPAYTDLLIRVRDTKPQKTLSAKERKINLKRAFKTTQNIVQLQYILVVDDIYTTGSTLDAAAGALKEAGAKEVYACCISIGRDS